MHVRSDCRIHLWARIVLRCAFSLQVKELLRKLFLTGAVQMVMPGTPEQIIIAFLLALIDLVLSSVYSPYLDPADDALAVAMQFLIVMVLFQALIIRAQVSQSKVLDLALAVVLVVALAFVLLALLWGELHPLWVAWRKENRRRRLHQLPPITICQFLSAPDEDTETEKARLERHSTQQTDIERRWQEALLPVLRANDQMSANHKLAADATLILGQLLELTSGYQAFLQGAEHAEHSDEVLVLYVARVGDCAYTEKKAVYQSER